MLDLKEVHLLQKIIFQLSKMGFLLLAKSEKNVLLDLRSKEISHDKDKKIKL